MTHALRSESAVSDAQPLEYRTIVDVRIDGTSYEDASSRIIHWASLGLSKYVCVAAVNNVMEAHDNLEFRAAMNEADLVTPDGMPLVWGLRALGVDDATRVYGPDLTPAVLERAAKTGTRVGFYGGTPEVLEALLARIRDRWPDLAIVYSYSPPFTALGDVQEAKIAREINASGTQVLFVGLGCPKQELWMARHRGRIHAVMVGIGAAFDFLAGNKKQAPLFMRRTGTEWLFRLVNEPKRLWRRYLRHNPRFVGLFGAQLIRSRRAGLH